MLKKALHIILSILLTVITQIGGIIYLIALLVCRNAKKHNYLKQAGLLIALYLVCTFVIVPNTAPLFGREKVYESEYIKAPCLFYKLANRNYVRPQLNTVLKEISSGLQKQHAGIKLVHLDANFPFINKFPLLPHLSHNDGRKIDLSLIYENPDNTLTNRKPSISGYGVFEGPKAGEYDQIAECRDLGYWQYDFPKYLTLGRINRDIHFSENGTADLMRIILKENNIGKVFIEPHLKKRMGLTHEKIRYHGCRAVRHDDHIHIQLK
ncbi:hypothetical protein [Flavobacterium rhizosphaerae]|uniref:Uncharacterized protein n=1 Tax=Flavobacterium rhizosphaerae TaxID=3163298 RepID=A0ABW8YYG8_9FLAO